VKEEDLVLCSYTLLTRPVISPSFASVEPCHSAKITQIYASAKKKTNHTFISYAKPNHILGATLNPDEMDPDASRTNPFHA